jgi:hypothetical protein
LRDHETVMPLNSTFYRGLYALGGWSVDSLFSVVSRNTFRNFSENVLSPICYYNTPLHLPCQRFEYRQTVCGI